MRTTTHALTNAPVQLRGRRCAALCLFIVSVVTLGSVTALMSTAPAISPPPAAVPTAAVVRHAPTVNGRVEGSVRQLTGENVTLNGGAVITGDLMVPGTPTLRKNGNPSLGGTVEGAGSPQPTGYTVTLNGNAQLGRLVSRTDPVALPTVAPPPPSTGTRSVVINNSGQSAGDFATVRDLTLNGNAGLVSVPPGTYRNFTANGSGGFVLGVAGSPQPAIYNLSSLTLNGLTQLKVVGPVVVTLATAVSFNGTAGSAGNPSWLTLKVASGGVTLNGGGAVHGSVVAPSGTVIINGNSKVVGSVACDRLTLNGNSLLQGVGDTTPPVLTVEQPADGALTRDGQITVAGTASDQSETSVTVNGVAAARNGNQFSASVPLSEGPNTLRVTAVDLYGNQSEMTRAVRRDATPPALILNTPSEGQITRLTTVSGKVTDASAVTVTADDLPLAVDAVGNFSGEIQFLEGVAQTFQVVATDAAGNRSTLTRTATVDRIPPAIKELSPAEGTLAESPATVRGRVTDATAVTVSVGGVAASVGSDGLFTSGNISLADGDNEIPITAVDAAGNDSATTLLLKGKDRTAPAAPVLFPVISPTRLDFQAVEGRVESGARVSIAGGVEPVTVEAAFGTGLFTANIKLAPGANLLSVSATDTEGNASPAAQVTITSDPNLALPPAGQPAQINNSTGNTQKGLTSTELPRPLIVIASDRTGAPVPGVSVRFTVQEGGGNFVGGGNTMTAVTDADGHARVRYVCGMLPGPQQIRADYTGNTSTPVIFLADALETLPGGLTTVSGVVLDQNLRALPNVLVRIGGQQTRTGADGRFRAKNVASGPHQLLELVGRDQVTLPGRWPNISYDFDVLPGVDNDLGRPLFLPKVNNGIALPLNDSSVVIQDTTFELPAFGSEPPVRVTAKAGTRVQFPPDVTDKRLSVTRIATDRVPMALEDGRATNLYISVQPSGAVFETPLEVSFPNLDRLPANKEVLLMSFDHDAGRYVRVGTGHVSQDGKTVKSDPGSGIRVGAWHALPPDDPQPEVTILSHIKVDGNPAFENKQIINVDVFAEGKSAVLMTSYASLDTASRLDWRLVTTMPPGVPALATSSRSNLQAQNVSVDIERTGYIGMRATGHPDPEEASTYAWTSSHPAFVTAPFDDGDDAHTHPNDTRLTAQGAGRATITVTYRFNRRSVVRNRLGAASFLLTCYVVTDEQQDFINRQRCTAVQNPNGLTGEYCRQFLVDVRMQGSGRDRNGQLIQIDYGQGNFAAGFGQTYFHVVNSILTASGRALAANSVAVDRGIIALGTTVGISEIGNRSADDTGGRINNYHIDVFGGYGRTTCQNTNGTAVNAWDGGHRMVQCNPSTQNCP